MTPFKQKCNGSCMCDKEIHERIENYLPILHQMSVSSVKERLKILEKAPPCVIKLLCEGGLNILKGNIKLKTHQYKKLKPHKRLLLTISKPSISLKQRRTVLGQKKGGVLPVVIPILLSVLASLAGRAVAKAAGI